MTYELLGDCIKCLRCGKKSHNQNDINNRYCGNCKLYHSTELSDTEILFTDLWGSGFVYNIEKPLSKDSDEFIEKIQSGQWLMLKMIFKTDTAALAKLKIWYELFDNTLSVHEIGATEAVAFFTQKKYTDVEQNHFKRYMDTIAVLSKK
jgi:hypothetical protein